MDSKPTLIAGVTLLRGIAVGNIIWGRGDKGTAAAVSTGISEVPGGMIACLYSNLRGPGFASPPRCPVKTEDFW
jgi:hypothetical protein